MRAKVNNYENLERVESKYRLLSDLERYEIFNTEEAEKYDTTQLLDFEIDEEGNIITISTAVAGGKSSLFGAREYVIIPWEHVTKVGANVIVVSADREKIKRRRV